MKLVFPNGEHGQVLLSPGINRIGASADCAVMLNLPGIVDHHCEIHVTSTGANLQIPKVGGGPVQVNGKPVSDLMSLRAGDQILIAGVLARYAIVEAARSAPMAISGSDEDSGATRVRQAIPKFMLRGVSGAVFSKMFPVGGPVVIGRAPECDISVPADEISRRHALVKPTPDGLSVEDLGSSNGTYVNGKRVQQGFLGPGDELRLDAVRFVLLAPGVGPTPQPGKTVPEASAPASGGNAGKVAAIVLTVLAVGIIAALLLSR